MPTSAAMLGVDEGALRKEIWPDGASEKSDAGKNTVTLGSREIELPADVDAAKVQALFAKRRGGQELTADERALMRRVFQQAGGFNGQRSGGGAAGAAPGGGLPSGGFAGSAPTDRSRNAGAAAAYQFGGDYWVVALRDDKPTPVAVRTGLTDLAYSEIKSGLKPGDQVLLLPSRSLYEQQERLQQFISQRFGSSTPFQTQQRGGPPRGFR